MFCSSGNIYCVGRAFYSSCNVSLGASFAVSFQPEFDFLISAAFHANETLEITEHFDPVTNGCLTFWHFPSVTVSLEAQMVSGSEVGESHSMEYIHIPKKGLLTKSLEFGKEAKKLWLIHHLFSMAIIFVINCLEWDWYWNEIDIALNAWRVLYAPFK